MKIQQQPLLDLLGTPDTRFTIPRFQRAYSWTAIQCDELWRDLSRAAHAHKKHGRCRGAHLNLPPKILSRSVGFSA